MMARAPQRYEEAVDIATLTEWPGNPRRGDEKAIEASMQSHGFYGSVLAQASTRRIIAGNHRTRVARSRGETDVPVIWLDVDDDEALRIMLVDNRSNDQAHYDNTALLGLLHDLQETDDGVLGTGYHERDVALLEALLSDDPDDDGLDGDPSPALGDMTYRIVVECDDEEHQRSLIETMTSEGLTVRAVIN